MIFVAPPVELPRSVVPGEPEILALLPPEARGRYAGEVWDRAWRPDGSRVPRILNAVFPNERPLEAENWIADREGKGPYVVLGFEESAGARIRRRDEEPFWWREKTFPEVALLPVSRTPVFPVPGRLVSINDIVGRFASVRRLERPLKRGDRLRVLTRTGPWREAFSVSVNGLCKSRSLGSGPWGTLRYVSRKEILDAQWREGRIGNWGRSPAQVELVPPPGGAKTFVRLASQPRFEERDDRPVPSFVQGIRYDPPEKLTQVVVEVAPMRERVVSVALGPRFRPPDSRIDGHRIGPFRLDAVSVSRHAPGITLHLGDFRTDGRPLAGENRTRVDPLPLAGDDVRQTGTFVGFRLSAPSERRAWQQRVTFRGGRSPEFRGEWSPLYLDGGEIWAGAPIPPGARDGTLLLRRTADAPLRSDGPVVAPPTLPKLFHEISLRFRIPRIAGHVP